MITDTVQLATRSITPEGYLAGEGVMTKVGIQQYLGSEILAYTDEAVNPNTMYNVFRPASTVFDPETISSSKLKPMTCTHPDEFVDSENNREYSIGSIGENVRPLDEEKLGCNLLVTDAVAVDKILAGTHELSPGYTSHIIKAQGEYKGLSYDYMFDAPMTVNHLALVERGRGGSDVRIFDHKSSEKNMTSKVEKDSKVESKPITDQDMTGIMSQVADNLSPMIEKMVGSEDFQNKLAQVLATNIAQGMQGGDGDVVQDDLSGQVPSTDMAAPVAPAQAPITDSTLAKVVNSAADKRASIIMRSKALFKDLKVENKSNKQLMTDALGSLGIKDLDGKNEQYLHGMLDSVSTSDMTNRAEAAKYLDSVASTEYASTEAFIPVNGIALRKINSKRAK